MNLLEEKLIKLPNRERGTKKSDDNLTSGGLSADSLNYQKGSKRRDNDDHWKSIV